MKNKISCSGYCLNCEEYKKRIKEGKVKDIWECRKIAFGELNGESKE